MKKNEKKLVMASAVLSFVLVLGTFQSLGTNNVDLASVGTVQPLQQSSISESLDGARINQLYPNDTVVSGVFNSTYRDVYVYVYVNDKFKAFNRVKSGNVFSIKVPEKLNAGDTVKVDISAYNSNYKFSSPYFTVAATPGDVASVVKDVYAGEFKFDKPLVSGDQSLRATFPSKYTDVFVNIYVDGKYEGGREFKTGNSFKVDLRDPLKVGNKVEIKMYSYKTKTVLQGNTVIEK